MRMTIEKMLISNFKGTREIEIEFGEKTNIFGMNGTGKTTIPDAFSWVLFNKDSHGNAPGSDNFREKPLDENGEEIHNLDTTVELICKLDGQPFNLRRTQRENWVKKRGYLDSVYQGNVSTYWINDVETKLVDFKARIAQITSEEVFRLIASLSAFNAMEWKKRRQQLITMAGVDVDSVLLQRGEYSNIASECATRGVKVEELRKIMSDQRKRTNDELKMFPVRIDEARKALPENMTESCLADAKYLLKECEADIEKIDRLIAAEQVKTGNGNAEAQIQALEREMRSHKARIENEIEGKKTAALNSLTVAQRELRSHEDVLSKSRAALERDKRTLEAAIRERNQLRAMYTEVFESKFDAGSAVCPTCKQPMPAEIIRSAEAEFAANRVRKLQEIKTDGAAAASMIASLEEHIQKNDEAMTAYEAEIEGIKKHTETLIREYDAVRDLRPNYGEEPRIAEIVSEIENLRKEINTTPDDKIKELEARKAEINRARMRATETIVKFDTMVVVNERIAELEREQRDAGVRIAEVEQMVALIERFIQDRCSVLEEGINAKFPTLRWKLFERQINGGINDTCECMIPCESGLVSYSCANTAAQINADIEIVNVLSEHYGIALPLFVDNSERVNRIADTHTQLVTLSVSTDTKLRIEKEAI